MGSVKTQMESNECENKSSEQIRTINANKRELQVQVIKGAKKFALTRILPEFLADLITKTQVKIISSHNHVNSEAQTQTLVNLSESRMGSFDLLPNEVIIDVLAKLTITDLSNLAITCHSFRLIIKDSFIKSEFGLHKVLPKHYLRKPDSISAENICLREFEQFGLLLKRVTCLSPTTTRLQMLSQVLNKLGHIPSETHILYTRSANIKYIFKCFGKIIHILIAGWDDSEVIHLYKLIERMTHIPQHIHRVLVSPVDSRRRTEYYVRICIRNLLLDPCRSYADRFFWLNLFLSKQSYSQSQQARLMMIIYGPFESVSPLYDSYPRVMWFDLTDTFFIQSGLQELGFAIHLLHKHSKEADCDSSTGDGWVCASSNKDSNDKNHWPDLKILSLFDSIISTPEPWLPENIATLLFFAGDEITFKFLELKMKARNCTDLAISLVYLSLVNYKLAKDTTAVYNFISKLLTHTQPTQDFKQHLIHEISFAFAEAISDADSMIDMEDERDVTEIIDLVNAQSSLMELLFERHFNVGTDKKKTDEAEE